MTEDFISVVPTVSQLLEVPKDVKCSFEGCSKTFSNKGNLHMHLIKSHGEIKNDRDASIYQGCKGTGPSVRFHCPVEPCMYNKGAKKYWATLQLVRQHFKRVHAERKFACSKCSSKFSCEYDLNRHLSVCGVMYSCGSCPVKYTTKEALLMHCKRGEHEYPAEYQRQKKEEGPKKRPQWQKSDKSSPPVVTITPILLITTAMLPGAQEVHEPVLSSTSLSQNCNQSVAVGKFKTISPKVQVSEPTRSVQNIFVENVAHRNDVVIQTDIYGVDALSLSTSIPATHTVQGRLSPGPLEVKTGYQLSPGSASGSRSPSRRTQQRKSPGSYYNPGSPRRKKMKSSTGMQTSVSLTKKKGAHTVNSTQTPGDFILQAAMKTADIKIQKKTVASQVTPRKAHRKMKSSQIQTFISGFRPQLVDSSSQVQQKNILSEIMSQNMAEQETMTERPMSISTQTMQSFLEDHLNRNSSGVVNEMTNDFNVILTDLEMKGIVKESSRDNNIVAIYTEDLNSCVEFRAPTISCKKALTKQAVEFASNPEKVSGTSLSTQTYADNVLLLSSTLQKINPTSDMDAQTMSASDFDLLLQSESLLFDQNPQGPTFKESLSFSHSIGISNYKDSSTTVSPSNRGILSVETNMADMDTQTGMDFNIFRDLEPIDSNTQTTGIEDMDFLDLVMSNMETQTLSDSDLINLGLLDDTCNLSAFSTHSMAVGTSDFDTSDDIFSSLEDGFGMSELDTATTHNMGIGTSDFELPYEFDCGSGVGHKQGTTRETLSAQKLDIGPFEGNTKGFTFQEDTTVCDENAANGDNLLLQICNLSPEDDTTNKSMVNIIKQGSSIKHKTVSASRVQHNHQASDHLNKPHEHSVDLNKVRSASIAVFGSSEMQTQVDFGDAGFCTTNIETQTTFDDLQEFCEKIL
ncbi:ATM interactor-like isoform X1 [Dreissena polymorpha]|uniref:C2H2-type domain-containing protein n=2 Tax=Dreissena polymorpha TaxID=45954 RepID=A0A9D4IN02_DREPO|nr:ATM interactor-like isoform X1 [Dreissena polymorpha]KAH3778804.1 hypothetical protein DPMN_180275 [Dreissena polymorpha]